MSGSDGRQDEDDTNKVRFALSPFKQTPTRPSKKGAVYGKENIRSSGHLFPPKSHTSKTRTYRRKSSAVRKASPVSPRLSPKPKGRSTSLTLVADSQPLEATSVVPGKNVRDDHFALSQDSSLSDVPSLNDGSPKTSTLAQRPIGSTANAHLVALRLSQAASNNEPTAKAKSSRSSSHPSRSAEAATEIAKNQYGGPRSKEIERQTSEKERAPSSTKEPDSSSPDPDFGIVFSRLNQRLAQPMARFDLAAFNEKMRQHEETSDLHERELTEDMRNLVGEFQNWLSGHSEALAQRANQQCDERIRHILQMERQNEIMRNGFAQVVSVFKQTMDDCELNTRPDHIG